MKITNQICRVGIFPKRDDYFRLKGQVEGQFHYMTASQFTIGTAPGVEVVLTGKGVTDYGLRITVKDRELWIEDLNPASKTVVSGHPIEPKEPFHYKSGEVLLIDKADLLMTVDLFNRQADPQVEGDTIIREAKEQAESLVSSAHRQLEEKSRLAIEESHARAEAILQKAKTEADGQAQKVLERAQVTANNLLGSAKTEVEHLLKEAEAKSAAIKNEIIKITEEKTRLLSEAAQCKIVSEDAIQKKEGILVEAAATQDEFKKIRTSFEGFQAEVKKSEEEWKNRLEELKKKGLEFEEQAKGSQRLQKEAEDSCQQLRTQHLQLEKQVSTLSTHQTDLASDIKKTETEKAKCTAELNDLKVSYKSELKNLRQKIDDEFKRQLKQHELHFQNMREQENLDLQYRQASFEKHEAMRLETQIAKMHDRLWQTIADRATLFGAENLKENSEFKKDLKNLTGQVLTEDFELRRREVVSTLPSSRKLMAKHRFSQGMAKYAGWIVCLFVLGAIVYVQLSPLLQPERRPASSSSGH